MEVEEGSQVLGRWYIMPARKEATEIEEAAAALLDLAGVEKQQLFAPQSPLDMQRLGVECRHRGTELVTRWDSDLKVRCLMEMQASTMAYLRDGAAKATYCCESMSSPDHLSDMIAMTKMAGVAGVGVKFLSKVEVDKLVVNRWGYPADMFGVPKTWFPEVEEQLPGFNDK
jgi:hypothetical protein